MLFLLAVILLVIFPLFVIGETVHKAVQQKK